MLASFVAGCTEPPSYELGWRLVDVDGFNDPEQAPPLVSVKQCSEVGVQKVQVTTRRLDNSIAARQDYPCFPGAFGRGELVDGPVLEPGEYKIEATGLRRSGERWACVADETLPEPKPCVAFAEGSVIVAEGELPAVEFVLLSPPECDDGIDNDGDGLVDGKDPSCIFNPDGPEQSDNRLALFQLKVTFLNSPLVLPANVGVMAVRVSVDGEVLAEATASDLNTDIWPFRLPTISASLDPGEHELAVVAVDKGGQPVTDALLRTVAIPFAIFTGDDESLDPSRFDFTSERFLEPIIEPISVGIGLLLAPNDDWGPSCELGGFVDGARKTIDQTRIRVADQDGAWLDAATLELLGFSSQGMLTPVDEGDGWIGFACPSTAVVSTPLTWGNYSIEIESRIGDNVCFQTKAPRDLRPAANTGPQNFYLDRVVDGMGVPPAGCEECVTTSDCSGQVCDAGICKDKTP
jgi:hypothetical protein